MRELILINISGKDRPGLTYSLTEILAYYGVHVLDIGQSVIHDTLVLGILIEVPPESESRPVLRDVLFRAHELDLHADFKPIREQDYENWVSQQGKPRHIITLLGRKITADQISAVSQVVTQNRLNIDTVHRLSGRISLRPDARPRRACVEFSVRGTPENSAAMRERFMEISREQGLDISFQVDSIFRRNRRLVVFDMDSTLIQAEVIDKLAEAAGVGEEVSRITEQAMQGEIDFKESFRKRLSLLEGLDESVLQSIAESLPLTEGAERLITTLNTLGYKTAIISGGFSFFGRYLQNKLGIDYVYANELEIENGKVTGQVSGPIVDGNRKAELLEYLACEEQLSLHQVIAVGDGANDLPMLNKAGLGIAFRAKPVVRESAGHALTHIGLDGILYLIGVRDREVNEELEVNSS